MLIGPCLLSSLVVSARERGRVCDPHAGAQLAILGICACVPAHAYRRQRLIDHAFDRVRGTLGGYHGDGEPMEVNSAHDRLDSCSRMNAGPPPNVAGRSVDRSATRPVLCPGRTTRLRLALTAGYSSSTRWASSASTG